MPQHDYNIANNNFPDFRSDLNSVLQAIVTMNSGASAPATTFANQVWADTSTGLVKLRNTANTDWVTIGKLNQTNLGLWIDPTFTGTTAAPTPATSDNSTKIATTAFAVAMLLDRVKPETIGTVNIIALTSGMRILYSTTVVSTDGSGNANIPFNLTFGSAPIVLVCNGSTGTTTNAFSLVDPPSTTSFNVRTGAPSILARVNWIAIGIL